MELFLIILFNLSIQLYNAQSNVENVAADVNYCFEKIERHKNEANLNLIKNFQRSQEDFQLVKEIIKTTADELIEQSYHWTDFDYTEFTNYIKIIVKKIDENFKDFTTQWITTNANEIYKNMLKDLKSITNKEVLRITKAFNEKQNANFSCWTSKVDEFCALIEYKSYTLLPSVDDKNPIAGFNLKESVLQTYQACIGNQEAGRCIKNNIQLDQEMQLNIIYYYACRITNYIKKFSDRVRISKQNFKRGNFKNLLERYANVIIACININS